MIVALYKTNLSAWRIEKKRLVKKNIQVFSVQNRCIRGWFMSVFVLTATGVLFGIQSALTLFAIGLVSKLVLEIVNYMEHYGLVRHPRQRVELRHSWNSNKKISSWAMFNLPRHSHHHAKGAVPYHKLEPMPDAPTMISGYLSTMAVVLIPPLWFKLMAPKLRHWDEHFANEQEKELLRQAEETSSKQTNKQALV